MRCGHLGCGAHSTTVLRAAYRYRVFTSCEYLEIGMHWLGDVPKAKLVYELNGANALRDISRQSPA